MWTKLRPLCTALSQRRGVKHQQLLRKGKGCSLRYLGCNFGTAAHGCIHRSFLYPRFPPRHPKSSMLLTRLTGQNISLKVPSLVEVIHHHFLSSEVSTPSVAGICARPMLTLWSSSLLPPIIRHAFCRYLQVDYCMRLEYGCHCSPGPCWNVSFGRKKFTTRNLLHYSRDVSRLHPTTDKQSANRQHVHARRSDHWHRESQ